MAAKHPKIEIFEKLKKDLPWWPFKTINMAVHDFKKYPQGDKTHSTKTFHIPKIIESDSTTQI